MSSISPGGPQIPPGSFEIEIEACLSQTFVLSVEASQTDPNMISTSIKQRTQLVFDNFIQIGLDSTPGNAAGKAVDERIQALNSVIGQSTNAPVKKRKMRGTPPPAEQRESVARATPLDLLGNLGSNIALRSGQEVKVSDQSDLGRLLSSRNIERYQSKSGHTIIVVADDTFRKTLGEAVERLSQMLESGSSEPVGGIQSAPVAEDSDDDEADDVDGETQVPADNPPNRVADAKERWEVEQSLAAESLAMEQDEERRVQMEQERERFKEDKEAHLDALKQTRTDQERLAESQKDDLG